MFVGYKHSQCLSISWLPWVWCIFLTGHCIFIRLWAARDSLQARCVNYKQQISFHFCFSIFSSFPYICLYISILQNYLNYLSCFNARVQHKFINSMQWLVCVLYYFVYKMLLNVCGLSFLQCFGLHCAWPAFYSWF